MNERIKNIIAISDTHFGCKLGLCPDVVTLDEGGTYHSSALQKIVWSKWNQFWNEWVPEVTKKEPYYIVHNGDIIDGVHHGATTLITNNIKDQSKIAIQVMRPILDMSNCKGYYQIRGTEVHVGKSACDEETIAKELGAIPDDIENYARWELWLRFGINNNLVHFAHHIGTTSSSAFESTAPMKEYIDACVEAGRWGDETPDCIVRSHRHRNIQVTIPTKTGYGISLVTPGWQLKTPFVYRVAMGRSSNPQIGGCIIREGDEDSIYTRSKVWNLMRTKEEKI